jgi:hypothetical protein
MAIIVSLPFIPRRARRLRQEPEQPLGDRSKRIVLSCRHRPAGGLVVGAASGAGHVTLLMPRVALSMRSVM